jgi:hypothetical protein
MERMGFGDPDLSTPAHDAVMIWLSEHIEDVVEQLVPLGHGLVNHGASVPIGLRSSIPAPARRIGAPKWEYPLLSDDWRRSIVGFVDMLVPVERSHPVVEADAWRVDWIAMGVYLEVKTRIDSLGETIRQIRGYQRYAPGLHAIVSPDDRFRVQLESQRIRFVLAPTLGERRAISGQQTLDLRRRE